MSRKRIMFVVESIALPSSHVSAGQYLASFRAAGHEVLFVARDRPEGFERTDRIANWAWRLRMRRRSRAMKEEIRRRWDDRIIELAAGFDVVYVVKSPSLDLHCRLVSLGGPRVLVGFADAFWLPFARDLGWGDLEEILSLAHGIVCVNEFTASHARRYNPRVFIVNDGPQTEDFDRARGTVGRDPERTTIGWIGSPATAGALFRIWEPLEDLFDEFPALHLRLVGTGPRTLLNLPRFEKVRWSLAPEYDQSAMIQEVLAMDIGLFPLFRGEDSLARGGLKANIYMSGEVAVVAQRYAENPLLIEDGVNGMLCSSDEEWREKIAFLIRNPDDRKTIARRGLASVRERFSRQKTFEQLHAAIESV